MELYLEGLDCPNCAEKIRLEAEKNQAVKSAEINFPAQKLIVSHDGTKDEKVLFDELCGAIKKIEPDVKPSVYSERKRTVTIMLSGVKNAEQGGRIRAYAEKMNGVKKADFNFHNGRLTLELSENGRENIVKTAVESYIATVAPDVKANSKKDVGEPLISKIAVARIIAAAAIFAVGMFMRGSEYELWIFIAAYAVISLDTVFKAVKNLFGGQPFDECLLMTIASLGAFFVGEYPEGVAVMLLYQIGEMFQDYAVGRSRKSISELMNIRPEFAVIKRGGELVKCSPEEAAVGEIAVVKPGEKIPLDGIISSGSTNLDTSALTGESVPRSAAQGDEVLGGCVNLSGLIEVEITREFGQSAVSKILELVENSAEKKAPTENFITRFARIYTPCVVGAALLTGVIPMIIIGGYSQIWLYRALSFLVVSCPCALVISVPLSFFCGIGGASRHGVLVKGGNCFETLAKCETVVFDKTGTLTNGSFDVTKVKTNNCSKTEILNAAYAAELNSNHPAGLSVIKYCSENGIKPELDNISSQELAGMGVKAEVNGKVIFAGNSKLMDYAKIENYENISEAGTVIHVACDGIYMGYILISDKVKADAEQAVKELESAGIYTVMLTGDRKNTADIIASQLNINEVHAELLPSDKVVELEKIMQVHNGKTAFVGDGINDAPVLMRADVGIAMGGLGSDAAVEAADVVLMTDEPSKIMSAVKLARRTDRIVRENIVFSLAVKALILVLTLFGITNMWAAVFADVGVSFIAIINAVRARK